MIIPYQNEWLHCLYGAVVIAIPFFRRRHCIIIEELFIFRKHLRNSNNKGGRKAAF